jgi:hypothetical protein
MFRFAFASRRARQGQPLCGLAEFVRLGLVCLIATLASDIASASPPAEGTPGSVESEPLDPLIAFGEPAAQCAWPSTVAVLGDGGEVCSGTLIHPEVVLFSGSCGNNQTTVHFGENILAGGRQIQAESCVRIGQGYPDNVDWGYCHLSEPVVDIPIIPPIFGCEWSFVQVGAPVVLVGFGATEQDIPGIKHWAETSIIEASIATDESGEIVVGPQGQGSAAPCLGDGPVYIGVSDGSWRLLGASVSSDDCANPPPETIVTLPKWGLQFAEIGTNEDFYPCHQLGAWAPEPSCSDFDAQAPGVGSGTWANWCAGTPRLGPSTSCGPAWDSFDASLLPYIRISTPGWGEKFPLNTPINIWVEAAKHPGGFALRQITVVANDVPTIANPVYYDVEHFFSTPPYTEDAVVEIVAHVEDWAGNIVTADSVKIGVGDVTVPPNPADEPPAPDVPPLGTHYEGCTVAADAACLDWLVVLLLLTLLARPTRRSARI